ncbi:MAG: InlB B-repeat-containing protein [Lachnospiraceae bacterium]|nr:InlB B-repeat-containing protein [Lachnospiraceae bacterium]
MKKIAVLFTAVLLAVSMMSFPAFAGGEIHVTKESELKSAWDTAMSTNATIYIENDITLEDEYVVDKGSVTIDLQGNNIEGIGDDADFIFSVEDGASLTIKNTTDKDQGTIYISHDHINEDYDQLIYVDQDSSFTLEGGTLMGNDDVDCRIVYVDNGLFIMKGGSLTYNVFDYSFLPLITGGGGAVCVIGDGNTENNRGRFIMYGGTISDIDTTDSEGAVYIEDGVFEMYDGLITQNKSAGKAAGVYVCENMFNAAVFNMYGGEISKNINFAIGTTSGMYAGGVAIDDAGFYMHGGVITKNITPAYGGGVYYDGGNANFQMFEGAVISENEANKGGGVYIDDGRVFLSGGIIEKNIANEGGGLYCHKFNEDDIDGVDLKGTLVITGNKGGGVYLEDKSSLADDPALNLGGSVQIIGNEGYDLYYYPEGKNLIGILDDLNTDPDDHAWVGISSKKQNYPQGIAGKFNKDEDDKDYSVIFLGENGFEIMARDDMHDGPIFVLYYSSSEPVNITSMGLNQLALEDKDGNTVPEDDYTVTYDNLNLTYTVTFNSGKGMNVEEDAIYIRNNRQGYGDGAGLTLDITPVKMVKTMDSDAGETVYTLYYLCENWIFSSNLGGCDNNRDVYYTVEIVIPDHTVSFEMNGHGEQITAQVVPDGENAVEPENPEEANWIFDGWFADEELTEEFDFETPITENTTVYAKWLAQYTVKFEMNKHGETIADQIVTEGKTAEKPEDPKASGWKFEGWFADAEFTKTFDFSTVIKENTTVYAKWTEVERKPVDTGDHSNLPLAAGVTAASLLVLIGACVLRKKSN